MANSSREYESTNRKVIVLKPNEFFSLKQLGLHQKKQRLQDLKRNFTANEVSFISKGCNEVKASSPQGSEGASCRYSPLKLAKSKYQASRSNRIKSTPHKKYKRKVLVVEEGLEKTKFVDFADLSRATSTNNKSITENNVENEIVSIDDDTSEEKIIELIDKKYGPALEAQLGAADIITHLNVDVPPKTHQEIQILDHAKVPSGIYEYKLREEEFIDQINKEQDINEEVKEVQRHLESILISDSSEDGYTLFTRAELKRLPEKIFESPRKISIKQEMVPKKETLDCIAMKDIQFQNLKINFKDCCTTITHDTNQVINNTDEDTLTKKNYKIDETNTEEKHINCEEKWEVDPKYIHAKEITISNEDAAILKEMDEFIEEINVRNKSLGPKEPSAMVNQTGENLDHNYCQEYTEINQDCSKTEDGNKTDRTKEENQKRIDEINVSFPASSNVCVDAARFEDAITYIIKENRLFDQNKSEKNESKTEESVTQVETKKTDILAKLVLEAEIHVDQSGDIEATSDFPDNCHVGIIENSLHTKDTDFQRLINKDNIIESVFQEVNDCTEATNTLGNSSIQKQNSAGVATVNNNHIHDNCSGDLKTVLCNSTSEESSSNEAAVLIIKENGFLELVNFDSNEVNIAPYSSCDGSQVKCLHPNETESGSEENESDKSTTNEERQKATTDKINREEIITLLEKARAVQYDATNSDGKTGKENLKHLSSSLRQHIGILKKLYEKLEISTELVVKEVDQDVTTEVDDMHDDLKFIKSVIEKSFAKEEKKKLKYKVVSIRRKSTDRSKTTSPANKPVTKKVYHKMALRYASKISTKLLHKTLLRMNKLLGIVEENRMLMVNTRRNGLVSKLKGMAEKDVRSGEEGLSSNVKKSNIKSGDDEDWETLKEQILENSEYCKLHASNSKRERKKSCSGVIDINDKSLKVVSKTPDARVIKRHMRNGRNKFEEITSQEKSPVSSENKKKNEEMRTTNTKDGNELQEKGNAIIQEQPSRYPLRSRKIINTFNYTRECQKDSSIDKTASMLPYEVNYSNVSPLDKVGEKLDYLLKNDNKPCVVLYNKKCRPNKSIFEKPEEQYRKKSHIGNLTQPENKPKEHDLTDRYETRSKTEKIKAETQKRILRTRKI